MTSRVNGSRGGRVRPGFTLLEVTVTLAILVMALLFVARVAIWSLGERDRTDSRQEAIEAAANVLERARSLPWNDLNADWADSQRLPQALEQTLVNGKLTVRVDAEPAQPRTKRVTVEIRWKLADGNAAQPVQFVSLFGDRTAKAPEQKP